MVLCHIISVGTLSFLFMCDISFKRFLACSISLSLFVLLCTFLMWRLIESLCIVLPHSSHSLLSFPPFLSLCVTFHSKVFSKFFFFIFICCIVYVSHVAINGMSEHFLTTFFTLTIFVVPSFFLKV